MGNTLLAFPDHTLSSLISGGDNTNLATNGTFATDTGWTKGSGWAISGGVATATAATDSTLMQPLAGGVLGKPYVLQYTISSISQGGICARRTGANLGTVQTAPGTYSEVVVLTADLNCGLTTVGATTATIDNVVIKEFGQWSSTLPAANLKDKLISKVARTTGTATFQTRWMENLGAAKSIKVAALLNHNLSLAGTARLIAYTDDTFATTAYDSGTVSVWPNGFTSDDRAVYPNHFILVMPSAVTSMYWRWELSDVSNDDGYVQVGRSWLGPAWQPTVGIVYGGDIGYEPRENVSESLGGVMWGDGKQPRRAAGITFPSLRDGNERASAMLFQKQIGNTGEVLFVEDVNHSQRDLLLYAFPATVRQMSRIRAAAYNVNEMPLELLEIL